MKISLSSSESGSSEEEESADIVQEDEEKVSSGEVWEMVDFLNKCTFKEKTELN